eukprot:gene16144-22301_t
MLRSWFPSGISLFRKNKIQEDRYSVEETTAKVVNFVMESRRQDAGPLSEDTRKESFALAKHVAAKITDLAKLDYLMDPCYPAYWAIEMAISMIFGLRKDNEYCMGAVGLLTHVVSSKNPIGSIEFLGLLEEASLAVRFLHKSGMVHSDVKAENFLIKKKQAHSVKECAYHAMSRLATSA